MKRIYSILIVLTLLCIPGSAQEYKGLTHLETLILPTGTESIGSKAFAGCRALTQVTCAHATAPDCAPDAFASPTVGKAGQATLTAGSEQYADATGWQFFAVINTVENSQNLSSSALATTGSDWVLGIAEGEPFRIHQASLTPNICYTAFFQESTGAVVCDVNATLIASPAGTEQTLPAGTTVTGLQPGSYLLKCGDIVTRVELRTSTQEKIAQ
jgi:hypothetical protein